MPALRQGHVAGVQQDVDQVVLRYRRARRSASGCFEGRKQMRLIHSILLVLAFLVASVRADPVASIVGPETQVETGDLVELDASKSVGDAILWKSIDLPTARYRIYDGGKKLCFAAKTSGRLRFMLIVAGKSTIAEGGDSAGIAIVTAEHVVDVKGTAPTPSPIPEPGPTPQPPKPADKWGLRSSVAEWGSLVDGERQCAPNLAANYRSIARLAASGKMDVKDAAGKVDFVATCNAMNAAVGAANATLPSSARPHWLPLIKKLNERVMALTNTEKSINTVSQYAEAFEDIAAGLDIIK